MNKNIDHIPKETIEKLYKFRLSEVDKKKVELLF